MKRKTRSYTGDLKEGNDSQQKRTGPAEKQKQSKLSKEPPRCKPHAAAEWSARLANSPATQERAAATQLKHHSVNQGSILLVK